MSNKIMALLWDVDVCLVDTHVARKTVQNNFLLSCGISESKTEEIIKAWERLFWYFNEEELPLILSILKKQFKEDKITDEKIAFIDKNFDLQFLQALKLTNGAKEVLDFCKDHEIPLGIVSNGKEAFQWKKIHYVDIAKYFPKKESIVIKDPDHGKPFPDGILECCKIIGVEPHDAAFIGDRKSDIIAANLAGCMSIQFMAKAPEAREPEGEILDIEKPSMQINNLREILPLLQ